MTRCGLQFCPRASGGSGCRLRGSGLTERLSWRRSIERSMSPSRGGDMRLHSDLPLGLSVPDRDGEVRAQGSTPDAIPLGSLGVKTVFTGCTRLHSGGPPIRTSQSRSTPSYGAGGPRGHLDPVAHQLAPQGRTSGPGRRPTAMRGWWSWASTLRGSPSSTSTIACDWRRRSEESTTGRSGQPPCVLGAFGRPPLAGALVRRRGRHHPRPPLWRGP